MTRAEVKKLFREYRENEKSIKELELRILELETLAEKMTPSYQKSEGSQGFNTDSKVEEYCIKIEQIQKRIDAIKERQKMALHYLGLLKPHQKYLIKACLLYNVSYSTIAKRNTQQAEISKE